MIYNKLVIFKNFKCDIIVNGGNYEEDNKRL